MPVPDATPLAYVGFGPGQELIPYFWALLSFLAAAFVAIVQWPIAKVRGLLRRSRGQSHPAASAEPAGGPNITSG